MDNDAMGAGNEMDYGMRIYDSRVGRFLSIDPLAQKYPELSPYQFASNSPISGVDQDGLEYSPAGRRGIFSIDNTAVQLYPDNPGVIEKQKAAVPAIQFRKLALTAQQFQTVLRPTRAMNEFQKERHEIDKANWFDRDGYTETGKPTPATSLAGDKTWTAFADNLALPALDLYTLVDGGMALRRVLTAPGFISKAEFSLLSKEGTLDPFRIRFSQDDINFKFLDGNDFAKLVDGLKRGDKIDIPPIRIVQLNDMTFTLDNRRLFCYRQANVPIPYKKMNKIPRREFRKFSNSDIGNLIRVRKPKK
jgi:RHS repeat-associated protein